jgi:hypothetical protein
MHEMTLECMRAPQMDQHQMFVLLYGFVFNILGALGACGRSFKDFFWVNYRSLCELPYTGTVPKSTGMKEKSCLILLT